MVNGYCYVKKWCNWWVQMQTNKNLLPQQFVKNIVENFFVCNITIGSRFSDWAHYNEFVESGAKSWVLMIRRLILGMKGTQNRTAQHPREKGPLARGWECANPSRSRKSLPPVFGPLLLFIPLFCSSSSYTCQSSMPIFKCMSPQLFFLVLCELLWPPSPCPGVTSTSKGVKVLIVCI